MCCFCVSEFEDTSGGEAREARKLWTGGQMEVMGLVCTARQGQFDGISGEIRPG